jgi:hypothetical protein
MNKELKNDIKTCDAIIVSQYNPHVDLLDYFDSPKIFIGYTGTRYVIDDTNSETKENETLINFLQNCICNTQYFFNEFYMVEKDYNYIFKCLDFRDFVSTIEELNLSV